MQKSMSDKQHLKLSPQWKKQNECQLQPSYCIICTAYNQSYLTLGLYPQAPLNK